MPQHPMIGCNRQKRHQPQIHGEVNSTMLVADVTEFFLSGKSTEVFSWCSNTSLGDPYLCRLIWHAHLCCFVYYPSQVEDHDFVQHLMLLSPDSNDRQKGWCDVMFVHATWLYIGELFRAGLQEFLNLHESFLLRFWAHSRVNHLEIEKSNTEHAGTLPRNDMSFHFFQDAVATRWPGLTIQ